MADLIGPAIGQPLDRAVRPLVPSRQFFAQDEAAILPGIEPAAKGAVCRCAFANVESPADQRIKLRLAESNVDLLVDRVLKAHQILREQLIGLGLGDAHPFVNIWPGVAHPHGEDV